MSKDIKAKIIEYLGERIFCVIATTHPNGTPEAAFVGYRNNDSLEFLIGTSNQSRKYKNLKANPHAALVVADTKGEIQYEGEAVELSMAEYDEHVAAEKFTALPGIEKYRNDPCQTFFKITPSWIRFIQHGESDIIEEFTEFN